MITIKKVLYILSIVSLGFHISATELQPTHTVSDDLSEQISVLRGSLALEKEKVAAIKKESILRQIFHEMSSVAFNTWIIENAQHIIDAKVYGKFVSSMRYLGETADFSIGNHEGFMIASSDDPLCEISRVYTGNDPNPKAVFVDFVGERAINNIIHIGEGDLMKGYTLMRGFIKSTFPAISDAIGHLAEQKIKTSNTAVWGPRVNAEGNVIDKCCNHAGWPDSFDTSIHWIVAKQLGEFFGGEYISGYENLGINPVGRDIEALRKEIENLYNPEYH
jgi:hypothetical protein